MELPIGTLVPVVHPVSQMVFEWPVVCQSPAAFYGYGRCESCVEYQQNPVLLHVNMACHLAVRPRDTRWWHRSLVPRSYGRHNLCENFITFFAYNSTKGRGLSLGQGRALNRFRFWHPRIQLNLREQGLDLQYLFEIFDDFFFGGALKAFTILKWVPWSPDKLNHGETLCQRFILNTIWPVNIVIATLEPGQAWTRASIHSILSTLLHEMAHAAFHIYACQCYHCRCAVRGENANGFHGPNCARPWRHAQTGPLGTSHAKNGAWVLDCLLRQ